METCEKCGKGSTSCQRWCRAVNSNGYGHLLVAGKLVKAHRFVYEWKIGPIPKGLDLDHLCRVRNCVNPQHLEIVTRRENVLRGAKGRLVTHCPQGHALIPENLLLKSRRDCKLCHAKRERGRRARTKQLVINAA